MRIGMYLADQRWERTLSKGIYSHSRTMAAQLFRWFQEHEVVLIVNRSNRSDMVPAGCPPARVVQLPAVCARGPARLVADHIFAPFLARQLGLDLIHFPKGFVPWPSCGMARVTATIHDTIPLYYARHYPEYFPRAKLLYFKSMYWNSLRSAHGIMTVSCFSRDALLKLATEWGISPPPVEVCGNAPDLNLTDEDDSRLNCPKVENRLLHLGSILPHKRTRDTIRLFRAFNRGRGGEWRLGVTGIVCPPREWKTEPGNDVEFLGTLSAMELQRELRRARALLLLSSVEGFGLPAIESWFLGTPVCYSTGGALPEILEGIPGRCLGSGIEDFAGALDEILALSRSELVGYQERLRHRFNVERFGRKVAEVMKGWLEASRKGP